MSDKIKYAILSIVNKFSDDSGRVLIEDVYRLLRQKYNIDRISAGQAIIQLYGEGKITPCEYDYMRKT